MLKSIAIILISLFTTLSSSFAAGVQVTSFVIVAKV